MKTIAWFVSGKAHADMARVSIASARKVDRHVCPLVMTDEPDLEIEGAEMVRVPAGMPMMSAIIEGQLRALWNHRTPIWFIDNDTLLTKPLPELWEEQIVVTWRDRVYGVCEQYDDGSVAKLMPYNAGLIGVMPGRSTFEAFLWMRERLRRMASRWQDWYGNQFTLAALAGPPPSEGETTELREIPWIVEKPNPTVLIRKIPCEIWNYTPLSADEDISGRGMLHFKNKNRYLMPAFAELLGVPWVGGEPVTAYARRVESPA